jgi:hypothetical protein
MVVLPSNRPAKVTAKENRGWRAIQGSGEEKALAPVRGASLIQLSTGKLRHEHLMRYEECNRPENSIAFETQSVKTAK